MRRGGFGRARAAVSLCRGRLSASRAGRLASVLAGVCAASFAAVAIALRTADGAQASLSGLTPAAAQWIVWLAGVPLAYAAAADRAAADRRDGIEALAASRGISLASLEPARALAAMSAIARTVGIPLAALAFFTAALAGRSAVVLHRGVLGVAAIAFAIVVGVTVGGVASACARIGRARGRWLLLAVIVGPWALADLAGHGAWSIPGALGAVLDAMLGPGGYGA